MNYEFLTIMNDMKLQSNLFQNYDVFLFDGDGVIYKENEPIEGALSFIQSLLDDDKQIFILTNNSTKTRLDFRNKLSKFGLDIPIDKILSSAFLTAKYIAKISPSAKSYIIGEEGLKEEFSNFGLTVVNEDSETNETGIFEMDFDDVDYVVTGMDRKLNYVKISRAVHILKSFESAKFIATNADFTFPTKYGLIPGGGAMIKILEELSGRRAEKIIGKPESQMFVSAKEISKSDVNKIIMFGDRLETDIVGAKNVGITTCLVLSGVTTMKDLERLNENNSPDIIINSLQDAYDTYTA